MNESKIIEFLRKDQQERAFRRLYKYYPKVEKHIVVNSGSKEEALDIFQDALVILYKKVQELDASSPIKIDGFLINTCKLLWSNELRKKKVRKGDETGLGNLEFEDEINHQIEKEEKFQVMEEVLKKMGEKCKSILEMFYFKSLSMENIAKKIGYKTVKSAKVQKYKCMETARQLAIELSNTASMSEAEKQYS
ncbi:sigma-70 family RNA polymerase sigma factor [Paracrocinitomix mangrovi]|uniref:RNA polymerase sigma factor n=1 Tax=Paracrocinitomix mangrovi TaxID=2862509 RepID=UPI001C8DB33F|nr:sigma-70 family RNA polymerase sigma factor [Paracrocinitomix mangrovi]UKN00723.1 sigma-70 family RNA polymerase sigma factor [Paracrocinitomix mangrovi]